MFTNILTNCFEANDEEKDLYELCGDAQATSESKSGREINILLVGDSGCGKRYCITLHIINCLLYNGTYLSSKYH